MADSNTLWRVMNNLMEEWLLAHPQAAYIPPPVMKELQVTAKTIVAYNEHSAENHDAP